jgi:hypothetical protein
VKKTAPPSPADHQSSLLLPYVEDLLSPPEKEKVNDHLNGCAQCAAEAEALRETIALLGGNKEAFCPEVWELYEYAHYGKDSDGLICRHLRQCDPCRESVLALTEKKSPEVMPDQLWRELKQAIPGAHRATPAAEPYSETFFDRVSRLFRFPAIAMGVATAAVLAVVLLRPPDMPQSVVALSSVAWEKAPKPKGLHPSVPRAAIVLSLKDLDPPWPKERIDALYQALAPSMEMYDRIQILTPAMVRQSLDRSDLKLRDTRAVAKAVAEKLSLSAVAVVMVAAGSHGARVQIDLLDASTGRMETRKTEADVPWTDLDNTVRQLTWAALLQLNKGVGAESKQNAGSP